MGTGPGSSPRSCQGSLPQLPDSGRAHFAPLWFRKPWESFAVSTLEEGTAPGGEQSAHGTDSL